MTQPNDVSPVNPLPPVVVALCLIIAGVEAAVSLGARGLVGGAEAIGWRITLIQDYGFSGRVFDWMRETNIWPAEQVQRFVTYAFVHGSFTHAVFGIVMILALGKMVGDGLGNLAVAIVFVVSSIAGAVVYGLVLDTPLVLIGAFPAAYGLIGTFTYMLWLRLGQMGQHQIRAFRLIGFLMGIQLVFGLFFGSGPDWVADLTGFATGFALGVLLVPGGVRRIVDRLRRD
ncbi:MAG: rhomboid family intramembrane serine protease [Rhodobacteraceae bacterium]|nr:rhomboid family intramembrane serine protease [Paracoccaceae bacterium]